MYVPQTWCAGVVFIIFDMYCVINNVIYDMTYLVTASYGIRIPTITPSSCLEFLPHVCFLETYKSCRSRLFDVTIALLAL